MSAAVWPPISHEQLIKEEEDSLACELKWLLNLLQESLASLKSGLQECLDLLAPKEPGSTLALSSWRSESVKGFVTRVGTRIIKGDINLRLTTLAPPRALTSYPVHLQNPLPLPQLTALLTLLNQALDIIDISRWTGDPHNGAFISGQLRLLADTIEEAQQTLKGGEEVVGGKWWEDALTEDTFSPPIPQSLSLHLSIADAALLLHVRTLAPQSTSESSLTGLSLRTRLGLGPRPPVHDELDRVFHYREGEVIVKEKVRVESQDPSLMAVMAKLSALGHAVGGWRLRVGIVMGEDQEGDE